MNQLTKIGCVVFLALAAQLSGFLVYRGMSTGHASQGHKNWIEKMKHEQCSVVYIEKPTLTVRIADGMLRPEVLPGRTVWLCDNDLAYVR